MAWSEWYPTNKIYSYRLPLPMLIRHDKEKGICQEGCLITEEQNAPDQEAGHRWWLGPIKPCDTSSSCTGS